MQTLYSFYASGNQFLNYAFRWADMCHGNKKLHKDYAMCSFGCFELFFDFLENNLSSHLSNVNSISVIYISMYIVEGYFEILSIIPIDTRSEVQFLSPAYIVSV